MRDGLMMDWPLTLTHLLDRGRRYFAGQEIATRTGDGWHRYTFADWAARTERLAAALAQAGIRRGDRVATLAWNSYRHFEAYFAVPCMGAVLHTVNFRLHPEQIARIMNHAEDTLALVDASVYPVLEQVRPRLRTVRDIVVLDDLGAGAPPGTTDYEAFLRSGEDRFAWPALPETAAAAMCYTSGTTGDPKGCLYSHRSQVLHTLGVALSGLHLDARDRALVIVPMFHANAWGFPLGAACLGYGLVFPGRFMQPDDLAGAIADQRVTYVSGVPTIMTGVYQAMRATPRDYRSLRLVTVGGSAMPRPLLEGLTRDFGVRVTQGWGLTETSPVASIGVLKPHLEDRPAEERTAILLKQGLPLPMIEPRIVGPDGRELPWDGKATGELQVRGPWVIREYYQDPRSPASFQDGWFRTGDVASLDAEGYIQVVDRVKDLVKSGGEWISSVDLENTILRHPRVAEAAVIAAAHPKWAERPLACVVSRDPGLSRDEVIGFLRGKVADWWLPDDVVFLDELPKTSVGKIDKKVLRQRYGDHLLRTPS